MLTIKPSIELWPHQQRGHDELVAAIAAGHKRICFTSPTGGGKTRWMVYRIIESDKPTAIYTNRKILRSQLGGVLDDFKVDYGLRASGCKPALLRKVQLAMVQSEHNNVVKRGNWPIHRAEEVFVDEAHNNSNGAAKELVTSHLDDGSILIGLTATPLDIGHLYDHLIVGGTNSELRKCGAIVPAYHYGPDEPDVNLIGKVPIGEGECGIETAKRMKFAHRVFGRVREHYDVFNPHRRPAILFAPGVKESIWFAQQLTESGIPSAHIDGADCWVDGELHVKDQDLVDEIADRSKSGDIKCVCNRFVLREGIDWGWIYHGIFATVFGSLTSYIQAGGRVLRNHESLDRILIQDHGGNWWRHGSLNADQDWDLSLTNRIVAQARIKRIREGKDPEPITCPKCSCVRMSGPDCPRCGYRYDKKHRIVLQADGTLRAMKNDRFRARRTLPDTTSVRDKWRHRINGIKRSKKPTVRRMSYAQVAARFAEENGWNWPPEGMPGTPIDDLDWFRRVVDVPEEDLNP